MLAQWLAKLTCPTLLAVCACLPVFSYTYASTDTITEVESDAGLLESLPFTSANELLSDDNLLIVELVLGKYRLASDIFIYHTPELTLVPLQPLFDALEFPILVDPEAAKANGWFLSESSRFDLNYAERKVQRGDETLELSSGSIVIGDGIDLYVDIETFNRWFPVQVSVNISRLRLVFESEQPLPLEKQLDREKRRKSQQLDSGGVELPRLADHYRWIGSPAIDVNLSAHGEREPSDSADGKHTDGSYSIQGSMDLLGMQSRWSTLKSSRSSDTVNRFTLSKKPNHPDQPLPVKLDQVHLGDIFSQSDALVFRGGDGLGADLSWGGQQQESDFGKRIVEGNATPGWEVELYRNGGLIDFQLVDDQGRYRFEDVPVEYGENIFDIRLYGPQGQEDARRELVRVGNKAIPKGKVYARASLVNIDESVFHNDENDSDDGTANEKQSTFNLQAGLTDAVSIKTGYARHENPTSEETSEEYHINGVNLSLAGAAVSYQHAEQKNAGHAQLLSLQTRLGNTSISYLQKNYSSFSSSRNLQGAIKDDYELRLSGYSSLIKQLPVSYQLVGDLQRNQQGHKNYSIEPRISFSAAGGRISLENTLNDSDTGEQTLTGRARYLRSAGYKVNLRAAADYSIKPDAEINRLSTSAVWRPTESIRSQLSLMADLDGAGSNQLDLSVSYLFDYFSIAGNFGLREGGQASFGINLEFGFDKTPRRRWKLHNEPVAAHGRVAAQVFLDNNVNGEYDEGDEPLQGVYFTGRQKWAHAPTNEQGKTWLYGLRSDTPSTVKMDMSSLEDPYMQADFEPQQLVSHAGALRKLDIPVVMTGEAEGMLLLERNGQQKALAGIPLQLTRERDGEELSVNSEFDGYFIFDKLLPGVYQLTLDPDATTKLGVTQPAAITVNIEPGAGVTYIGEIVLQRDSGGKSLKPPSPAATNDSRTDSVPPAASVPRTPPMDSTNTEVGDHSHSMEPSQPGAIGSPATAAMANTADSRPATTSPAIAPDLDAARRVSEPVNPVPTTPAVNPSYAGHELAAAGQSPGAKHQSRVEPAPKRQAAPAATLKPQTGNAKPVAAPSPVLPAPAPTVQPPVETPKTLEPEGPPWYRRVGFMLLMLPFAAAIWAYQRKNQAS